MAGAEQEGEVRPLGVIANRVESIRKLVKKLGPVGQLRFCYEAGPTGYVVYWQLTGLGAKCEVVAPTLVPVKSGDRVKTDRRDALKLARNYRAGELTSVWVPDAAHEALRDLVRAREAAKKDQLRARHRLIKFLLRHGRRPPMDAKPWSANYLSWLKHEVHFEQMAQEATLLNYRHEVEHAELRIARLNLAIEEAMKWTPPKMRAVIEALQALRGVAQVTAVTIVAEVGEVSRFSKARQLMGYGGIVAREHSSGESAWRGLPPPPQRWGVLTETASGGQRRNPRARLESTASVAYAVPEDGPGQGKREGGDGDCARAVGFYLGHWGKSRGPTGEHRTASRLR